MSKEKWNAHYTREKSGLLYPDENLVRMISAAAGNLKPAGKTALDIGCGSGRHLLLLEDFGFQKIIGLDYSLNSLALSKRFDNSLLINADMEELPIADFSVDVAVCWGSLHYSDKTSFYKKNSEIFRILKKGGYLFGTLRSSRDTYMRKGAEISTGVWVTDLDDIKGSTVSFYDENELYKAYSMFSQISAGLMERTPLGSSSLISHWYFTVIK